MDGHIYIYGTISPYMDDFGEQYGEVTFKNLNDQLTNNKEADNLIVHINSNGGDVNQGFAFHDILRATGKKIITQAEGMVASIATVVFLAGDERKMTENSSLMIHNPWGFVGGDSEDIQKYADMIEKEEDKMVEFYAKKTGQKEKKVRELMKDETYMNPDEAISLGFATEKITQIKAVAQLNIQNMNKKEFETAFEEKSNGFFANINALLRKVGLIKALVVQTGDGRNLDFGDGLKDPSEIAVGAKAQVDGKTADGEMVMPDGRTFIFASGELKEIKEAAPINAELVAANAEIERLKAENTRVTAELQTAKEGITGIKAEFETFKSQITSDMKGLKNEPPAGDPPTVRKPFKNNN